MITRCRFVNGPAIGVLLTLERIPLMLRVVVDEEGKWDALNEVDDEVKPGETVHVYRACGEPDQVHIDKVEHGRRCGEWSQMLDYSHWPNPGAVHTQRTEDWCHWTDANKARLIAGERQCGKTEAQRQAIDAAEEAGEPILEVHPESALTDADLQEIKELTQDVRD